MAGALVVPERFINHKEMTLQLFDPQSQQWIPFLGAGVSSSAAPGRPSNPSREPDPQISQAVECLRKTLGLTEKSLFFLQSAMELARELERVASEPIVDMFTQLKDRDYPPSAAELTEVFRGNGISAFELAAETLLERLRYQTTDAILTDVVEQRSSSVRELTQEFLDRLAPLAGISAPPLSVMSSHFEISERRQVTLRKIGDILRGKATPTATHKFVARVAAAHLNWQKNHFLIVTTNYDCLMEQALENRTEPLRTPYVVLYTSKRKRDFMIVRARFGNMSDKMRRRFEEVNRIDEPQAPDRYRLEIPQPEQIEEEPREPESHEEEPIPQHLVIVYKLHGCIHDVLQCPRINGEGAGECDPCPHDGIVLSDEDYIESIAGLARNGGVIPAAVTKLMRKPQMLFLGYSLKDWNVRGFLKALREKIDSSSTAPPRAPDRAVVHKLSRLEETFFLGNNVSVLLTDLNRFSAELERWATVNGFPQ